MAKEGKYAHVRLPSGEMRLILAKCRATIGVIGNSDHENVKIGKAGRKRHMGIRPTVRGSVMNPVDHPHDLLLGVNQHLDIKQEIKRNYQINLSLREENKILWVGGFIIFFPINPREGGKFNVKIKQEETICRS